MKPILITCYIDPDLDGIAGAFAYNEFLTKTGQSTAFAIIGEAHDEAKYLFNRFGIPFPQQIPNAAGFDEIILVDASELKALEDKIPAEKVIELIDHRKINDAEKFPNAKAQIEMVGAAATLIAEKFMQENAEISKESAILLYAAIISNTLNFKGAVTTERDRKAADWLNITAQLPENFWKELFTAKSDLSGPKLATRIAHDFALFNFGSKEIGIGQIEIIGAQKLIEERGAEIIIELEKTQKEMNLDYFFQNTIGLDENKNFLITSHEATKKLLEEVLEIKFNGNVAERPGLIMRKQIVPLLKAELEK